MVDLWFASIIPKGLLTLIAPISLIVIGHIVEKNYVGRISAFSNALAINIFFYEMSNIPTLLIIYSNAALILGVFGLVAYYISQKLPYVYYILIWGLSSFVVGAMMLWFIVEA